MPRFVDALRSKAFEVIRLAEGNASLAGLSGWKAIGRFRVELTAQLMRLAEQYLVDATGPEKKAAVLALVGEWFDAVVPALPVPILGAVVKRLLRQTVLFFTSSTIDELHSFLSSRAAPAVAATFQPE